MSRTSNPPKYRHHKPSGRAVVTIAGRDVYLGPHGSPESKREYRRIVAEFLANGDIAGTHPKDDLTVSELIDKFRYWAEGYYRLPNGEPTSELEWLKASCKPLRGLYGHTAAKDFGPVALETIRQDMIRDGLSRSGINAKINRIRRVLKWGVSKGLVPSSVFESTRTLVGLRRGRSDAYETEPVKPVADEVVDATLPQLSSVVRGMVEFQRATGCRPGEVCRMKIGEIDMTGEVWAYRPEHHKTAHHGLDRTIFIGTNGQASLWPFLGGELPGDFVFSPRQAVAEFRGKRYADRKTPAGQGNVIGSNRKRKPKKKPGECYTVLSYGQAIRKASDRANRQAIHEAAKDGREISPGERLVPRWHANQLRHAFATKVRLHFGLEGAQVVLGHSRADVTQVYAERDRALAEKVCRAIG